MFKQFMTFIGSILEDQEGGGSSKRVALLWLTLVIWSFVNYCVFKSEDHELKSTVIMYDAFLIAGFGGLALAEKFTNKTPGKEDQPK